MGIVELFFPRICVGCGREGKYICELCRRGVMRATGSLRYTGVIRKALKEIKYRGSYDMVKEVVEVWDPPARPEYKEAIVTAVPMWSQKERVRGFNQAELIARELAKRWELTYERLLERTRETAPMYGLTKSQRVANVAGAFKLVSKQSGGLIDKRIILVDDVWTTGATVRECVKVLKRGEAQEVWFATLAC